MESRESPTPASARQAMEPWMARAAVGLLLAVLLLLAYLVMANFLVPFLWAAILAYITWPLNRLLRQRFHGRGNAALLMTFLLAVAIVVPLLLLTVSLRQETREVFEWLGTLLEEGAGMLPRWLLSLPWLGPAIGGTVDRIAVDPQVLNDWLAEQGTNLAGEAADLAGALGRNVVKFGIALLAAFFVYRDGEALLAQFRLGLCKLIGPSSDAYWAAAADMTRAVVYGLVLTAMAQGILAGIGYWVVGTEAPLLLGVVTALAALVPFGAPVIWGSVAIYLMLTGALWEGLGLAAWGALAVSSVDNLVRPLVISLSSRIPFLLVLFGVLGGLSAFGLVGLFLGPIILSVLLAVWRHWLEKNLSAGRGA